MATFTTATTAVDKYTFTGSVSNTLFLQFQRNMQRGDFFDGGAGTDKIQIRSSMAGEEDFDVRGITFRSFEQLSYELILAIAIVSGFTERLLLRAVDQVVKTA